MITDSKSLPVDIAALKTADGNGITVEETTDGFGNIILTAYEDGTGDKVFTMTLDAEGGEIGEFEFDLHQALSHPYTDSDLDNDDNPDSAFEDNFNFAFNVIATDTDKDTAQGTINIKVDDDSPTALDDHDEVTEGKTGGNLNIATGNVVTGGDATLLGKDSNFTFLPPLFTGDGTPDLPGADRPYTISKLEHDSDVYTLSTDGTTVLKNGAALNGITETFDGKVLKIPTDEGGTFEIVMISNTQSEVGEYRYTVPADADHAHDKHAGPGDLATSMSGSFDDVSEWVSSFGSAGITLVPANGNLALKVVSISGPNYRGIGVGDPVGGEAEVDNNGLDQTLTLQIANPTDNIALTIGALYSGGPDAGFQEIVLWQVFDGGTLVASGQILGSQTGLVPLDIDTNGVEFDKVVLTPLNNGAGESPNNSDFLLLNAEICCPQKEFTETFDYTLRDSDGDEDTATIFIDVKDTEPKIRHGDSTITFLVDEDGIANGLKNGSLQDDAETGGGANVDNDGIYKGKINFTPGADPVTIELSVGDPSQPGNGDTGLDTVDGKNVFAAWDPATSTLVGYIEGTDPSEAANRVFTAKVDNHQTGEFTFTLLKPVEHPDSNPQLPNADENNPNLSFKINFQIEDSDCDVAYGQMIVKIDDDMPVINQGSGTLALAVDESLDGNSVPNNAPDVDPDPGFRQEDDEDGAGLPGVLTGLGSVIGASKAGAAGLFTFQPGADGLQSAVYSLTIGGGGAGPVATNLVDTQDGTLISLFTNPDGTVRGISAGGHLVFAFSINAGTGEVSMAQYRAINHGNEEAAPGNHDEEKSLGAPSSPTAPALINLLSVTLTVTDKDNDTVSKTVDITNKVTFDDDGPSACIDKKHDNDVIHDESAGIQNDDQPNGSLPAVFSNVGLIGWARSDDPVVTTSGSDYGTDGAGTTVLSLKVSGAGVDSGLDDTATGNNILLFQSGSIVEGRVQGSGELVFAVSLNQNGTVDVAQYRAIEHPNPNDHDEDIGISNSALQAWVTITDKDGDSATASVDIGSRVRFDDDGPVACLDKVEGAKIVLDESAGLATGPYPDGNAFDEDGNVVGDIGYAKVAGNLLFVDSSSYGTDGPGTTTYTLAISSSGANTGLDDVATGQDIRLYQLDADTVVGRVGNSGGPIAFRIDINQSNGEVTISQLRAVEHDNPGDSAATHDESGSPEIMDSNRLFIRQTVVDGDFDKDTFDLDLGELIKFEDDGPVAVNDVDSVEEDGTTIAIGNVYNGNNATSFGSDANGTDGNADDIGSDGFKQLQWKDPGAPGGFDGNGNVVGLYGTLFVDSDGDYKYVLNNGLKAVQDLNAGDKLYDTFKYVITDKDNDTSTAELTITINGKDDTDKPKFGDENALVDEDGLPAGVLNDPVPATNDPAPGDEVGGNQEGGLPDPASEAIFRDSLNIDWDQDVGTIVFSVTNADLASIHPLNGAVLTTANVSGNGTDELGIWDGTPGDSNLIMTVKVIDEATSVYEVELLQPIQHTDPATEDNKSLPVKVTATNDGGTSEHTLTIGIDDDRPVAVDDEVAATPGSSGTADVVFIVDVSGSMTNGGGSIVVPDVPDFSDDRLGLARFSMRELLENHPEILNVQFVKFDNNVSSSVWMTRADALTYIANDANFVGGGTTNYDIALQEAMDVYDDSARPAGAAEQTLVYFLSDGQPNTPDDDEGITDNGTAPNVSVGEWETFVTTPANNITNVFAIGLGSAVVSQLEPIAYPNDDVNAPLGDEDRVIVIPDSNITALTQTLDDLLGSVVTPVTGDVTDNDDFGADGPGAPKLVSVTYDGTTYDFDPATEHTIDLGAGKGTLKIEDDGDYTYTPPEADGADGDPFYVEYVIRDGDGDTVTGKINIDLTVAPTTNNVLASGPEDSVAGIPVVLSGADSDGTVDLFKIVSLPANGTLYADALLTTVLAVGSLVPAASNTVYFVPNANYNGSTAFNYAAVDNDGVQDPTPATADITVSPVNDAPDAVAPAVYNATEQTNLNLHGAGLMSISDIDAGSGVMKATLSVGAGTLTVTAGNSGVDSITGSGTSSVVITGTVAEINNLLGGVDTGPGAAGTIVFGPSGGDNPPASTQLTLKVEDNGNTGAGGNLSDTAVSTINIAAVNDAPTTSNANASGNEDTTIVVNLSGADVDGSVAQFKITSLPTNGKLYADAGLTNEITVNETVNAIANAAAVFFVPNANFFGPQTFQFTAVDNLGLADASPATASITVNSVNDPTDAIDDILIIRNISDTTVQSAWFLRNDTDADGAPTITEVNRSLLDNPTSTVSNPGSSFTIDPDGSDDFTYKAANGGTPDQATVDVQEDNSGNFAGDGDSEIIVGTSGSEVLDGNGGNDVLFGNGGTDTLNGGAGDDWLVYDSDDINDGGADFDTLRFESGVDLNVDDDGGSNNFVNRVNNIEAIDLRNGAADDFGNSGESGEDALSAADVINMTDADATLYIMGDNGDEVRLDGNWTVGATAQVIDPTRPDINGLTFTQYTLGGATVYVQSNVDVDNNL